MRLYTQLGHYKPENRGHLIDLLKPLTKEDPGSEYGDYYKDITITDDPEQADIGVLPMSWNYYRMKRLEKDAAAFIQACRNAGLEVLTYSNGDAGITPWVADVILVRMTGYASKRLEKEYAMPTLFNDPLDAYFSGNFETREYKAAPEVGFCGHAVCPLSKAATQSFKTISKNIAYYMGLDPREPQQVYSSTRRRARALRMLEDAPEIDAQFVKRSQYRAGARTPGEKHATSVEFYRNIRETAYTLCTRGEGNFSKRLYETLALGRIPVFVNTDCILPFDDSIPWKEHMVWVEAGNLAEIGSRIREFHDALSESEFRELQERNRSLWLEAMTFGGFHSRFLKELCAKYGKPAKMPEAQAATSGR